MGKSGTTLTVKGTRGDDPNLTIPDGALITMVVVDGGAGSDTLNLSDYGSGVTVRIEGGFAKSSSIVTDKEFTGLFPNYSMVDSSSVRGTIRNVENLIGTDFNDFLFASINGTAKYIDGGAGNDVVESLGGNATLVGGTGSDWLVGYWPNVTLIGGTYANGVAAGDGMTDYFYLGSGTPTILDFEVGVDRLICEFSSASVEFGTWVSNGSGGSTLMVNGVGEVTLANIDVATAQTIQLDYALLPVNGHIEGSSGNDLLFVGNGARIHLGSDSGDDATVSFDIAEDILVFDDGVAPTWSDTMVNGAAALLGSWEGGSITIQGLGTDDVPDLMIEGSAADPAYGAPGPGPWSNGDDFSSISLIG
jgi:hypothetical protein